MGEAGIFIRSEDDAYRYLTQLVDGTIKLDIEDLNVHFEGWPNLRVYAKGRKYDQSITPAMMKSFLALQSAVYRSYAISKYNTPNINNLTKQEKEDLEIQVRVDGGSSDYNVDFQALAEKFLDGAMGKMTGEQMLIVILAAMLLLFGHFAIKSILEHRRQVRSEELGTEVQKQQLTVMQSMSSEETKRMTVMQGLIKENAKVDNIYRTAYDMNMDMLKGMESTNSGEIQGVALSGEQAHLLVQNARRRSNEIRLDGRFRILGVDSSLRTDFRIRVMSLESGEDFVAQADETSLTIDAMNKLQRAEWKRRVITLHINAKEHHGQVKNAKIMAVGDIEEPEDLDNEEQSS
ncbi:hypothetical protein NK214_11155 [Chromobacterium sp. S0633]|uniref:hypothetical protein n=1 Tax=Chromobacterium sp. S0633 TaxID=2957805 RepID=UPI0020A1C3C3|nr:hypothetical protein [Chromobacterium sp. S0633]MCP1290747.1 hypothetical protein [Chromobacterium sp. S0633]